MSSRYLKVVAVMAFLFTSGVASACPGDKMKSADGSQGTSTATSTRAGG